jgi:uncharacterized protein (TIGR02569 family)
MALPRGRGLAWRAGNVVVKPADSSETILAWQAEALAETNPDGLRISLPRRSLDGTFVVDGWIASMFCDGRHEPGRWLDVIDAGERFHASIAGLRCPECIVARDDAWSTADRAAWGEIPITRYFAAPHVERLARILGPVSAPSQVVHGDLTGNVLFADPLPPALVDLTLYCRPAAYASAIVVADALAWEGATQAEFDRVISTKGFGQFLARALLFRIVTDWLVDRHAARARGPAYSSAVELAVKAVE